MIFFSNYIFLFVLIVTENTLKYFYFLKCVRALHLLWCCLLLDGEVLEELQHLISCSMAVDKIKIHCKNLQRNSNMNRAPWCVLQVRLVSSCYVALVCRKLTLSKVLCHLCSQWAQGSDKCVKEKWRQVVIEC